MVKASAIVEVKLPDTQLCVAKELLAIATDNLRCISWDNMSFELMSSSAGGADTFNLSRPVKPGEQIDFFMSHSWHDNAERKWVALEKHVASFKKTHGGRSPTFWLDKVFITLMLSVRFRERTKITNLGARYCKGKVRAG